MVIDFYSIFQGIINFPFRNLNQIRFLMLNNSYLNNQSGYKNQSGLMPSHSTSNLNPLSKYNQTIKQNSQISNNSFNRNKQLGLNPNLNIEDEYVQNLLKQIHFMNMEIKLLKEKQAQSQNNALWGIINRTNEPLIKNIVDSSQKYQDMKKSMDNQHETLCADNIRLADSQNAILKQYEYLETKLTALQKKKDAFQGSFKQKNMKNTLKIFQYTAKLKLINEEKQLQKKRYTTFTNELDSMITEGQKEQSKMTYQLTKIRNDQIIEEQMQKQKIAAIEDMKNKIKILKEKFESNEDYQKAQEEQTLLKERIGNLQKNISGANFDLMQLNESIKMAEIQRQKQIKQRKQLTEQFESVKTMLLEILFMNLGRKQKQTESRKKDSVQIQKAQYQTKKLQKNLDEIKKKLTKCQDTQNQLRVEVQSLERQLQKLKSKRQQLKNHLTDVLAKNQQQDRILLAYGSQVRKLDDHHQKVSNQEFLLTCELQSVEKQIQYLRGRKDFLNDTLNLKDTLNQTKLQDLQRVVQKNIDLNETVSMLMGKWEQIKTFSRM